MLNESLDTAEYINRIRGHVTVELFDAKSGSLVDSREKHNFIANSGIEYLQYLQRLNFKNQVSVLTPAADTDVAVVNPFESIALSNSTKDTNNSSAEWITPGDLVGYAKKSTYSGPDTLLGSPNPSICETDDTHTKWVFDWPIQAANGTINSICWMPALYTLSGYSGTVCKLPSAVNDDSKVLSSVVSPFDKIPFAYISSNLIMAGSSTTVTKYDQNYVNIGSFTTITCNGVAWDSTNSKLWVISGSQIASYSQSGAVVDAPISITARSYRGLTFDGSNLWTVSGNSVYKIGTNGADLFNFEPYPEQIGMTSLIGSSYDTDLVCDVAWDSNSQELNVMIACLYKIGYDPYGYVLCGRRYDSSGAIKSLGIRLAGTFTGSTSSTTSTAISQCTTMMGRYFDVIDASTLLINIDSVGSNVSNYIIRPGSMGTRVLLPAPIVKTNAQTLRITYQMDYS